MGRTGLGRFSPWAKSQAKNGSELKTEKTAEPGVRLYTDGRQAAGPFRRSRVRVKASGERRAGEGKRRLASVLLLLSGGAPCREEEDAPPRSRPLKYPGALSAIHKG